MSNAKRKEGDTSGGLAAVLKGFSHTTARGRGFDSLSAGWLQLWSVKSLSGGFPWWVLLGSTMREAPSSSASGRLPLSVARGWVACWVRVRIGVFVDLSLAVVQWQRGSGCHLCYVSELACGVFAEVRFVGFFVKGKALWVGGRNLQLLSLNDGIVIWDPSRAAGSRVFQGLRAPFSPVARGD
ncbi:hypothetical protein YC2023_055077 [Brassica napus]